MENYLLIINLIFCLIYTTIILDIWIYIQSLKLMIKPYIINIKNWLIFQFYDIYYCLNAYKIELISASIFIIVYIIYIYNYNIVYASGLSEAEWCNSDNPILRKSDIYNPHNFKEENMDKNWERIRAFEVFDKLKSSINMRSRTNNNADHFFTKSVLENLNPKERDFLKHVVTTFYPEKYKLLRITFGKSIGEFTVFKSDYLASEHIKTRDAQLFTFPFIDDVEKSIDKTYPLKE